MQHQVESANGSPPPARPRGSSSLLVPPVTPAATMTYRAVTSHQPSMASTTTSLQHSLLNGSDINPIAASTTTMNILPAHMYDNSPVYSSPTVIPARHIFRDQNSLAPAAAPTREVVQPASFSHSSSDSSVSAQRHSSSASSVAPNTELTPGRFDIDDGTRLPTLPHRAMALVPKDMPPLTRCVARVDVASAYYSPGEYFARRSLHERTLNSAAVTENVFSRRNDELQNHVSWDEGQLAHGREFRHSFPGDLPRAFGVNCDDEEGSSFKRTKRSRRMRRFGMRLMKALGL